MNVVLLLMFKLNLESPMSGLRRLDKQNVSLFGDLAHTITTFECSCHCVLDCTEDEWLQDQYLKKKTPRKTLRKFMHRKRTRKTFHPWTWACTWPIIPTCINVFVNKSPRRHPLRHLDATPTKSTNEKEKTSTPSVPPIALRRKHAWWLRLPRYGMDLAVI